MKLSKWLQTKKVTMTEFASEVGVTHSAVWRWCNGESFPMLDNLRAIRKATKGQVKAVDFDPEYHDF
jgi:transcriptional regulator with XRE-family HTH domain